MYPRCGKLNPDGLAALARADDYEQVKAVAEYYAVSTNYFVKVGNICFDNRYSQNFIILLKLYLTKITS